MRLRVGDFEADLRCCELWRDGEKIKLQERPFQVLASLLERPGEVVTREEIRQNLWPADTFVDFEHSINTAINKLREALADDVQNPRYIETLPRHGYRLIAPVHVLEEDHGRAEADSSPLAAGTVTSAPAREGSAEIFLQPRWVMPMVAGAVVTLIAGSTFAFFNPFAGHRSAFPPRSAWVPITHFTDSATSPALSADGRMIAFIRGADTFLTPGQIFVKMLPDGQPVQLTHDDLPKMAPAFSPDGSRVAYTATDPNFGWNTWVLPVLGGEPQKLLPNAAALTWTGAQNVIFSEIKSGEHMGIATATESRARERDVYVPASAAGMAHRSWRSPDGKWILISEMDERGWRPCRLLPFDGKTNGETAGPKAARCTYAGWSPDGQTMYFSADAGDGYHIWRQHLSGDVPEQLTFGATEEEGIAVSPDGHSLVTSAGIRESTVWLHDSRGDRQISEEGFASLPGLGYGGGATAHSVFSPDGKSLFYIVRTQASRALNSGELWMTQLESGRSERVLPGVSMSEFDIAPDGLRVAFASQDADETWHTWLAPIDRHLPPRQITLFAAHKPSFGPGGDLYFVVREDGQDFVYSVAPNATAPRKMSPDPDADFIGISPQGNWWLSGFAPVTARPTRGGTTIRICAFCGAGWGPRGNVLYLRFRKMGEMGGGKTVAIRLPSGSELPALPALGLKSVEATQKLNVVASVDMNGIVVFAPGPNPHVYAYVRRMVQRNLFRITLN
jgi:eukaryotic-like serine/threonine-protein kinase